MNDFNTLNNMLLLFLLNIYFFSRPENMIHFREYIRIILNIIYDKNARFIEFILNYNNKDNDCELEEKEKDKDNRDADVNTVNNVTKYEDKYLQDIRRLNKEFVFEADEEVERNEICLATFTELNHKLLEEIKQIKNIIDKNKLSIANFELKKEDYCVFNEGFKEKNNKYGYESDCDSNGDSETKEEKIQTLIYDNEFLEKEYNKLIKLYEDQEGIKKEAYNISKKYIINKKLEKLNNCYVMEKTPLGNVLMIYNIKRESFSYYSDNTIPYRYLETVARKYVKIFNCMPIFVDMEEQLKLAEEREKEQKEKEKEKEKEENINKSKNENGDINQQKKKNVFAKFKSYNKDTSATTKSMAAPPKNSIPNALLTKEQENEKFVLKEKANCYTYEGKFTNFSFLKKVDRKIVDKKYGLSFADFKKIKKGV